MPRRGETLPPNIEGRIDELRRVYKNAQARIRRQLTDAGLSDFQRFRYSEQMRQIRAIVKALDAEARAVAKGVAEGGYTEGTDIAKEAMARRGISVGEVNLGNRIHTAGVQIITDDMTEDLLVMNRSIQGNARRLLRATQQTLLDNHSINDILARGVIEGETRRVTSERLASKLRAQLENEQFVTVNGRNFSPDYYAEMVTRTRTREAMTAGTINATAEAGVDLVQVSVHAHPRIDPCSPHQGKVYSISGGDSRFPRLRVRPPFHPNCKHVLLPMVILDEEVEALQAASGDESIFIRDQDDMKRVMEGRKPKTDDELEAAKQPNGTRVSKALRLPRNRIVRQSAKNTMQAIDEVHGDGDLPTIPIKKLRESDSALGVFRSRRGRRMEPVDILIRESGDHRELTAAHEVGHFLDAAAIDPGADFASKSSRLMRKWRDAVEETQAHRNLIGLRDGADVSPVEIAGTRVFRPVNKRYVDYLLSKEELFARSYAQYITLRSGDPNMQAQLQNQLENRQSGDVWYDVQWEPEDFRPVADALDELFERLEWRK